MAKGDICIIRGCRKVVPWGKVCSAHYARKWRNGYYKYKSTWNNLKKGQALLSPTGYLRININGKRVLYHRYLMEKFLKRKLKSSEKIHHINHIKTDNRIENLKIISQSEHISEFHPKKPIVNWDRINIDKSKANRWHPRKTLHCLIDGCLNHPKYLGLCQKHYQSYRKNVLGK
jgi:hypothetical protein